MVLTVSNKPVLPRGGSTRRFSFLFLLLIFGISFLFLFLMNATTTTMQTILLKTANSSNNGEIERMNDVSGTTINNGDMLFIDELMTLYRFGWTWWMKSLSLSFPFSLHEIKMWDTQGQIRKLHTGVGARWDNGDSGNSSFDSKHIPICLANDVQAAHA